MAIDATQLFERTDRAFVGLRDLGAKTMERSGVTPEWARLHAKGTAVANANAVFRSNLSNVTDEDVHTAVIECHDTLNALFAAARNEFAKVEDTEETMENAFRKAIAEGHADGYTVAQDYLNQEVKYFRNV